MDVIYSTVQSVDFRDDNPNKKDGQLIVLMDKAGGYYDMNGERYPLSCQIHVESLETIKTKFAYLLQTDFLYIVKGKGIYVWDSENSEFRVVSSINTDTKVTTSPDNGSAKLYLTGTSSDKESTDGLRFSKEVYLDAIHGDLYANKFVGTATSAENAENADKASKDSKGQNITSYIRNLVITGRTVTITDGSGKTYSYDTQDTDTHYETNMVITNSNEGKLDVPDVPNGSVYINILDNTEIRASHKILGSGASEVFTDSEGNLVIASKNTEYGEASKDSAGLMPASMYSKLESIETGANKYTLPKASKTTLGGVKVGSNISYSEGGELSLTEKNVVDALGYNPKDNIGGVSSISVPSMEEPLTGDIVLDAKTIGALPSDTLYAKSGPALDGAALKALHSNISQQLADSGTEGHTMKLDLSGEEDDDPESILSLLGFKEGTLDNTGNWIMRPISKDLLSKWADFIKPYRELTEEEYNALSVEEQYNGTVYYITDSTASETDYATVELDQDIQE